MALGLARELRAQLHSEAHEDELQLELARWKQRAMDAEIRLSRLAPPAPAPAPAPAPVPAEAIAAPPACVLAYLAPKNAVDSAIANGIVALSNSDTLVIDVYRNASVTK